MAHIISEQDTESLLILPTVINAPFGAGRLPLRAYRVYKGDQLIYPNPDELRLSYRLRINHTEDLATSTTRHSLKRYRTTIETTRPCYVRIRYPNDAEESSGDKWQNGDIMLDGMPPPGGDPDLTRYFSHVGFCIENAIELALPLCPRQSWRTCAPGDPSFTRHGINTRYNAPRFPRIPSEADTAFITREDLDTGEVTIWHYTPCAWYYRPYNGNYQPQPLMAGYTSTIGSLACDERIAAKIAQYPDAKWYPMKEEVSEDDTQYYKKEFQSPTREWFSGVYWRDDWERFVASWFSIENNTDYTGFFKFYNGRVQAYPWQGTSWHRYRYDRTYQIIENSNPTFSSYEAWKEAIYCWPDVVEALSE